MKSTLSTFLQNRFNICLYQRLGWQTAGVYVQALGRIYFLMNRSERRSIFRAVRTVFGSRCSAREQRRIARRVFQGILAHYYEKLFNVYSTVRTSRIFFDTHVADRGTEAVNRARARGRGVLLITGHYGGVEFMPGYLSVQGIPVSIVVKFATAHLREISVRKAKQFSIKTIDADATDNVFKAIVTDLKANRVVITQCDEIDEWRVCPDRKIEFLGLTTFLDKTMNLLIKRGGAETVFGLMHRQADHHYRFIAERGQDAAKRLANGRLISLGEAALKYMETHILQSPHGWYQWKKYPAIPFAGPIGVMPRDAVPAPVLHPSLGCKHSQSTPSAALPGT